MERDMGQKVRPTGFRVGIMTDWLSSWYASKQDFADLLVEDQKVRKYIKKKYPRSGISKIRIERTREKVVIHIHSAKVGMIIGKKGTEIDELTHHLESLTHRRLPEQGRAGTAAAGRGRRTAWSAAQPTRAAARVNVYVSRECLSWR